MRYVIFLLLSICFNLAKAENKSIEKIAIEQFARSICNPAQRKFVSMDSKLSCKFLHLSAMPVNQNLQSIVLYSTMERNGRIDASENEKPAGYIVLIDDAGAIYSYSITETQNSYRLYKMLPGGKLKLKKSVHKHCFVN